MKNKTAPKGRNVIAKGEALVQNRPVFPKALKGRKKDRRHLISTGLQPGGEREFSSFSPIALTRWEKKRDASVKVPALKHGANEKVGLSARFLSHRRCFASILTIALLAFSNASAQDGGTQSAFAMGVGARAIAMGTAYVATPFDASAAYWNAAGLDHIEQTNAVLFYAPLLGGANFNYIGFAFPTLQLGTLGGGVLNQSVGGVDNRDGFGHKLGTLNFGHTQLLLSYAKKLPMSFSAGVSFKYERQNLSQNASGGAGFDFGFLYKPESDASVLRDATVGVTIQNVIAPRIKLGDVSENQPRALLLGVAKPFQLGAPGNHLNLLAGYRWNEKAKADFSVALEYVFQGKAMLRSGYTNGAANFGGGLNLNKYQLDYTISNEPNAADVGALQHRVSLSIKIGKTRTQRIEILKALEMQRIQDETVKRINLRRKLDFDELMNKGKSYFEQGDYFVSMIRFASAREVFPDDQEAGKWHDRAKDKLESERQREMDRLRETTAAAATEQATQNAQQTFIRQQFEKGMQFLDAGKYHEAITEWERGLEQDPENALFKEWIDKTREELRLKTVEALRRAQTAENRNEKTDALTHYERAMREGEVNDAQRGEIERRMDDLRRKLSSTDLFRQGLTAYVEKDYKTAMERFEEALKISPEDAKLQQYRDDAEARANARIEDFANDDQRRRFLEAVRLIQRERYDEALKILTELQSEQRYNKRYLDAIDLAREKKELGRQ